MKHETALNYTTRKNRINFKNAYLTDKEVINRLLALSDELRDAYAFYQGILYAIETRDEVELKSVLYPTKMMPNTAHCQRQWRRLIALSASTSTK
uniref:hypothetical protein n=1 Tax=Leuconostoc mesenteroides TaxID=1245 RepID=UPI001D173C67|nr:hypothetical protein [Leuconostoc mesenteroides]